MRELFVVRGYHFPPWANSDRIDEALANPCVESIQAQYQMLIGLMLYADITGHFCDSANQEDADLANRIVELAVEDDIGSLAILEALKCERNGSALDLCYLKAGPAFNAKVFGKKVTAEVTEPNFDWLIPYLQEKCSLSDETVKGMYDLRSQGSDIKFVLACCLVPQFRGLVLDERDQRIYNRILSSDHEISSLFIGNNHFFIPAFNENPDLRSYLLDFRIEQGRVMVRGNLPKRLEEDIEETMFVSTNARMKITYV